MGEAGCMAGDEGFYLGRKDVAELRLFALIALRISV